MEIRPPTLWMSLEVAYLSAGELRAAKYDTADVLPSLSRIDPTLTPIDISYVFDIDVADLQMWKSFVINVTDPSGYTIPDIAHIQAYSTSYVMGAS